MNEGSFISNITNVKVEGPSFPTDVGPDVGPDPWRWRFDVPWELSSYFVFLVSRWVECFKTRGLVVRMKG